MARGRSPGRRPRIVILGAGFGGLAAARELADVDAEVVVIDRRNYHLFQPLLYQVATAALSPADIAWPIRSLLAGQDNARVLMGRVAGVDREAREVLLEDGDRAPFDWLIVATGARHAYFGNDDWEPFAPGLKKIDDALDLRRRILGAFEAAERCDDAARRRALTTFVVVGAGPTGVELAGALRELARGMARDYRRVEAASARVVLVEAGPRVLPAFDPRDGARARAALEGLGVEVRLGRPVTACDAAGVEIAGEPLAAGVVVWAAGVAASGAAKWLGLPADRAGRVLVEPDLAAPGLPGVYVIGDAASVPGPDGRPVPGVAPAAKQMGRHAARCIKARLRGCAGRTPFRYRDAGAMATIGRHRAVARIGRVGLSGLPAWLLWSAVHVWFLVGARSRVSVAGHWTWSWLSGRRPARLLTGRAPTRTPPARNVPAPGTPPIWG